jgi:putative addiction module CopG family antidote
LVCLFSFLAAELAEHEGSERPELTGNRLSRKLANSLAKWFLGNDPRKRKRENRRAFIGDWMAGLGGLEPPTSPLSVLRSFATRKVAHDGPIELLINLSDQLRCVHVKDRHQQILWIASERVRLEEKGRSMDQMNVSITDQLAGYVRKKVKSGRYNNASEVVREALRRMADDDERALRLAKPTAEDILHRPYGRAA